MATARRWYFYGVAFVSQMMLFFGVLGLSSELLAERGVGPTERALYSALIIVGLPVYALHWWLAQRAVQRGDDERGAILRKVYFYAAQAVTTLLALSALHEALTQLLGGRFSIAALDEHLVALLVSVVFWGYHFWLARHDAAIEPESGGGATARRWYQFGVTAAGLWLWTIALRRLALDLIAFFTSSVTTTNYWSNVLSESTALFIIGMIAWLPMWLRLQQRVARDGDEQHSVLRKFYLYAAVFLGAAFSLFSLAAWLQSFLKILMGDPAPSAAALTEGTGNSLVTAIIGALVWAYHARVLQDDARLVREAPQQASIRRLYYYLVAAISLTALIVGVANIGEMLLRLVMDWRPAFVSASDWWRERLAWGVAATLVGLPVWLRAWRRMQNTALAANAQGQAERGATLRKVYLYGVALVGAVVVLFNLSSAAYQFLRVVLGEMSSNLVLGDVAGALVNSGVAAAAWLYHLVAIRQDSALARETVVERAAHTLKVIVAHDDGEFTSSLQAQMQRHLPTVELITLRENAADYQAQLQSADLVVLPLPNLMSSATWGDALNRVQAKVLLVPLAHAGFSVLGQSSAPRSAQAAQQTVQWIQSQLSRGWDATAAPASA